MDEINSLEESLEAINEAVLNSMEDDLELDDTTEEVVEFDAPEFTELESKEPITVIDNEDTSEPEVELSTKQYTTFEDVESLSLSQEDNIADEDVAYPEESELEYPESFELELKHFDAEKQEDQLWQARTGLDENTLCGAIETIIFMSDKPVALAKIKNLIDEDLPLRVVHESLARLQEGYEKTHHGLRLLEVAEGYQFRTKATYSKYVQDLYKVNSLVLSPTALEVLAILAYKQPVSKNEVEKIRGVDSSHIVRGLMDKRLVRVVGRSEEAGKPALYGTTAEFLEVFNLADLTQLPPERELEELSQESIGKIGDIKTICAGDKTKFNFDEMDELESLGETIKAISSDTEFTKTLSVEEKKRKTVSGDTVRSAFDLLEEFVINKEVTDSNAEAILSELMSACVDPQVVGDLREGPFNTPDVMEDEEDFQMIDLDTGEAIELEEDELDIVVDLELSEEEQTAMNTLAEAASSANKEYSDDESQDSVDVSFNAEDISNIDSLPDIPAELETPSIPLFEDSSDEISGLAAALDQAFANLTGESLEDESDLEAGHVNAQDKVNDLDNLTDSIVDQASDLDIDLSFLKEDPENSSEPEL